MSDAEKFTAKDIIRRLAQLRVRQGHAYVVPNSHPFGHEIDLFSVTREGYGIDHEIKCSLADFRAEVYSTSKDKRNPKSRNKFWKHDRLSKSFEAKDDALERCPNFFYFVSQIGIIPSTEIPPYAGLIWFLPECKDDKDMGFEVIKRAPRLHSRPVPTKSLFRAARSLSYRWLNMEES